MPRNSLGAFGEAYAVGLLSRRGYVIIDRNVRFRSGELDIVAMDGDVLVIVEVKCRRSSMFGTPEESISPARFARLARATESYLQRNQKPGQEYRVDVVAIEVGPRGNVVRADLLQGVEAPGS